MYSDILAGVRAKGFCGSNNALHDRYMQESLLVCGVKGVRSIAVGESRVPRAKSSSSFDEPGRI